MLNIKGCQCGAHTITIGNEVVHMSLETFIDKFGEHMVQERDLLTNCNHCVNHWGMDLCACGSGEKPEECQEGFKECGRPHHYMPEILE